MPTTRIKLNRTSWTNLGAGPMFIQNRGQRDQVYWCLSSADPGNNSPGDIADLPQNELGGAGQVADVNITFTQNVWARGDGHVVVTN